MTDVIVVMNYEFRNLIGRQLWHIKLVPFRYICRVLKEHIGTCILIKLCLIFLRFSIAVLTCDIYVAVLSIRPSVCLSHSGIVSKRLNISSVCGSPIILVFSVLNVFVKF